MVRGRLRVFLGAAPGVGKTYQMLEEGDRLRAEGRDVVVALVETHGRAATAARLAPLEVLPRVTRRHRGIDLAELDLAGVLERAPQVALVDEFAHTNAPGGRHAKRWEDVEDLLDAGIDVLTTVNIQHIESLNDVVEQITGATQRETVPDEVLRRADQIEVVDLTPQALRDRLSAGQVYPAERIDAALSNYFRLGNLTALRELALLWLADEVDQALQAYRDEHAIDARWEARERVVVALTGGAEGATLLRRGARIAARTSGGRLLAVHVVSQDGLRSADPAALAEQRRLVDTLGGTFHQMLGDDPAAALLEFARSVNATQIVIGVSRRGRLRTAFSAPGMGQRIIRAADSIDVHIVNHEAAGGRFALPPVGGALSARRRVLGLVLSLGLGPLLTWLLITWRTDSSLVGDVLAYQLLVIVVALVGGLLPALFTAALSGLTLDWFFIDPLYTPVVAEPRLILVLALYMVNAALVSYVVDQSARRIRRARRAVAETEVLAAAAGSVLRGEGSIDALLGRIRESFGLHSVRLISEDEEVAVATAPGARSTEDGATEMLSIAPDAHLELRGGAGVGADERRLLGALAGQVGAALQQAHLERAAAEVGPLTENDRVRSALLSAVGHDLRRPLTAATTAVSSLRDTGVAWSKTDREALLATADESLRTLAALVTDLLDVSRLQAGVLGVALTAVEADDVVLPALDELGLGPAQVELDLREGTPAFLADAGLLQRVVVNLLTNAVRFAPSGRPARIAISAHEDAVQIRVIDHGPGIPPERREQVFTPFQRHGDTDNDTGLGLGLALSRGLTEGMGGTLLPEDTPGGGVTMVVELPIASARSTTEVTP